MSQGARPLTVETWRKHGNSFLFESITSLLHHIICLCFWLQLEAINYFYWLCASRMLSSYLPEIGSVRSRHSLTLVRSQKLIETLVVMIQTWFFCNFTKIQFTKLKYCVFFSSETMGVSESIGGWFIVAAVVLVSFQLKSGLKNDFSRSDGGEWVNEGLVASRSRCACSSSASSHSHRA